MTIPENQEVKRLSEYVNPEKFHEFRFLNKEGQYITFEREISSQYVVKIKYKDITFLIPCTLIASQFYFFSSRIIPYVLRNALKDTHKGITVDRNLYKIVMSSYFSSADAPKIIHFLTDPYAKESLAEFSTKNRKSLLTEKLKFPIYARFPFNNINKIYPCKVVYEVIENYGYVHFLSFAEGSLPYQKLKVEVIRVKAEKAEENGVKDCNLIPVGISDEPEETEYELSRTRPSKYLKSFGLRTTLEEDQVNVRKGILLSRSAAKVKPKFFKTEEKVESVSVEDKAEPYSKMERKTAKLELFREETVVEADYERNLEKFKELLQILQDRFEFKIIFMKELLVPIRRKNKNTISQVEYYDWEKIHKGEIPRQRRKFLLVIGKFPETNNLIGLLEVDQTGMSYSLSTFIFITKK